METLLHGLAIVGVGCLAFAAAGLALFGLRGTCSRGCDRAGGPLCGLCSGRPGSGDGAGR